MTDKYQKAREIANMFRCVLKDNDRTMLEQQVASALSQVERETKQETKRDTFEMVIKYALVQAQIQKEQDAYRAGKGRIVYSPDAMKWLRIAGVFRAIESEKVQEGE